MHPEADFKEHYKIKLAKYKKNVMDMISERFMIRRSFRTRNSYAIIQLLKCLVLLIIKVQ